MKIPGLHFFDPIYQQFAPEDSDAATLNLLARIINTTAIDLKAYTTLNNMQISARTVLAEEHGPGLKVHCIDDTLYIWRHNRYLGPNNGSYFDQQLLHLNDPQSIEQLIMMGYDITTRHRSNHITSLEDLSLEEQNAIANIGKA